jgi:hypothetical protein
MPHLVRRFSELDDFSAFVKFAGWVADTSDQPVQLACAQCVDRGGNCTSTPRNVFSRWRLKVYDIARSPGGHRIDLKFFGNLKLSIVAQDL